MTATALADLASLARKELVRTAVVGGGGWERWDPGGSELLPFFHSGLKGLIHLGVDGAIPSELWSIRVGLFILQRNHLMLLLPDCGFVACAIFREVDVDFFFAIDGLRRRSDTDSVAGDRPPSSLMDGLEDGSVSDLGRLGFDLGGPEILVFVRKGFYANSAMF